MAVWQYDVALVPKAGIIRHHGSVPDELPGHRAVWNPQDTMDEASPNYWQGAEPPERLAQEIEHILPPIPSWSGKALMFGNGQGHRMEIWLADEIRFRFDLRHFDLDLLRSVVRFARTHGLLWVSDTHGCPIPPELERVIQDIQVSDAYRFCQNPEGYLKALPKEAKVPPLPNAGPS